MIELNIDIEKGNNFDFYSEYEAILKNLKDFFKIEKTIIVDVRITDNKEIQKLNKKYRNKNYATDILSFDFGNKLIYNDLPFIHLGELVISYQKVEEQANDFGHSLKREYCYLFSHGLIHLMGYDHEKEEERIEMNKIVDIIFNPLNITREE
ncbi:rRNA maturation RNase YbeY [Mycoplasmopsis lipofaciens]|uniref:rRNA maturation RNase YbeY n=1 Tax=Mycoplasmopsis lipofaciens TaxID=114884 RepID=UPI00047F7256|nr:rRNA maturation RNase YbeY [Mycoplasmopsis lipofaciens]